MESLGEYLPSLILLVPLLAFLEACAVVGVFVSGVFLLSTSAYLFTQTDTSLMLIAALAFVGAFIGDHSGYLLGRLAGPRLWETKLLTRYHNQRTRALELLEKSALLTVCAGRLTPALRSLTPIVAGLSGLSPARFTAYDVVACSIWATGLVVILQGLDSFS